MAKQILIFSNKTLAGTLTKYSSNEYEFVYDTHFRKGKNHPISPTLPFTEEAYRSDHLFPFFANLLPEGANKRTICRHVHIDEDDYFSLLASFSGKDIIGNISIKAL